MAIDWKVGDKFENNRGRGEIIEIIPGVAYPLTLQYTNHSIGHWRDDGDIKKINKNSMSKIGSMMKRLLDADTQTLVKAGFINGDLELTSDGVNALNAIQFTANKAALVAEAQAVLDAQKENK